MRLQFTIPTEPRTKKNHQQIRYNRRSGRRFISTSNEYKSYVAETSFILNQIKIKNKLKKPITGPVNVKAIYYMASRRIVDISNLHECLHDVLVHAGILLDDSCRVIIGTDGSRVRYDKENPRTEVTIEFIEDETELKEWEKMMPWS